MTLEFSSATDRGLVRADNQDAYGKFPAENHDLANPGGQLFIVADGMGGHQGGQEASQMAVRIAENVYFSGPQRSISERLSDAVAEANRQIFEKAQKYSHLRGMGTTCTALVLTEQAGYVAHVGDSRAYFINRSGIRQLTQDHSHVADMLRQGILTEKEAQFHPQRSLLNRALGARSTEEIDIIEAIEFQPDDSFLLCSDGLSKVKDGELQEAVINHSPTEACNALIQMANDRGGSDNVTIQVIKVKGTREATDA